MKSARQMLEDAGMLGVAEALRETFGARLIAIRDRDGNGHGRVELLDEVSFPVEEVEAQKPQPYRGRERRK